jgi:AcrR family transcriptional regulator
VGLHPGAPAQHLRRSARGPRAQDARPQRDQAVRSRPGRPGEDRRTRRSVARDHQPSARGAAGDPRPRVPDEGNLVLTTQARAHAAETDQTRERILDVALHLFATEGTNHVPLTRIRIGAGQRNQSAVQYHFGNREGLIQAIVAQYSPAIAERRDKLLDARKDVDDPIETATAIFAPLAELLDLDWRHLAFLRILGEVTTRPDFGFDDIAEIVGHGAAARTTEAIDDILRAGPRLPDHIRMERIRAGAIMAMHSLSEHAVLRSGRGRPPLPTDVVLANLVDMYVGALLAPMSRTVVQARGRFRSG